MGEMHHALRAVSIVGSGQRGLWTPVAARLPQQPAPTYSELTGLSGSSFLVTPGRRWSQPVIASNRDWAPHHGSPLPHTEPVKIPVSSEATDFASGHSAEPWQPDCFRSKTPVREAVGR